MSDDLDKPKGPESIPVAVPGDILQKARNTKIEPGTNGLVISFFDNVENGTKIYEVPWTPTNAREYFPLKNGSLSAPESPPVAETAAAAVAAPETSSATQEPTPEQSVPAAAETVVPEAAVPQEVQSEQAKPDENEPPAAQSAAAASAPLSPPRPKVVEKIPPAPRPAAAAEQQPTRPKIVEKTAADRPVGTPPNVPPSAPPEPPLEKKPLSDRKSGVRSPFSAPRQRPRAVPTGPDAYLPQFMRDQLSQQPEQLRIPLEAPPTMQDILKDPKKQELFGMLVESIGGAQGRTILAKEMGLDQSANNTLTSAELTKLEQFRVEFQRRTLLLEEVQEATTAGDLEYMLQNDPALNLVHQHLLPERAAEFVRQHMEKLFFRLPEKSVDRIVFAQRATRDMRRSDHFKKMREQIGERLTRANFSFGDTQKWDDVKLREALAFLEPNFKERWAGMSAQRSVEVMQSIDLNRTNIMNILGAAISSDTALKQQIIREARTDGAQKVLAAGDGGPAHIGVAWEQRLKGELQIEDTDALRRRIRDVEFRQKVETKLGKSWDEMTATEEGQEELEEASYALLQEEGKLPNRKSGWFGMWLGGIFDSLFPDMQQKLANEFEPPTQ